MSLMGIDPEEQNKSQKRLALNKGTEESPMKTNRSNKSISPSKKARSITRMWDGNPIQKFASSLKGLIRKSLSK